MQASPELVSFSMCPLSSTENVNSDKVSRRTKLLAEPLVFRGILYGPAPGFLDSKHSLRHHDPLVLYLHGVTLHESVWWPQEHSGSHFTPGDVA